MPKLLLFVPCQRVAYDQWIMSHHSLKFFQGFSISLLPKASGANLKAADEASEQPLKLPFRWIVFSLWRRLEGDQGKKLVQICEIIHPSGKKQELPQLNFEMSQQFQRKTINVQYFPVQEAGDYTLRLLLKENDTWPGQ